MVMIAPELAARSAARKAVFLSIKNGFSSLGMCQFTTIRWRLYLKGVFKCLFWTCSGLMFGVYYLHTAGHAHG